jgi:hypothetical protein
MRGTWSIIGLTFFLWGIQLPCCAQDAPTHSAEKRSATVPVRPDRDVLLKAINFALTGSDATSFEFEDVNDCRVIRETSKGNDQYHSIEVFHFNNIDAGRIVVNKYQLKYSDHVEDWVDVQLHGEDVVREDRATRVYASLGQTVGPTKENEYKYSLHTSEYDRLVRALRYIYAHGCKSATSSF